MSDVDEIVDEFGDGLLQDQKKRRGHQHAVNSARRGNLSKQTSQAIAAESERRRNVPITLPKLSILKDK